MPLAHARVSDDVGWVAMAHPARHNALSEALIADLAATFDDFRDQRVRAVVLRSAPGSKVWSAGHDISELPQSQRDPLGWSDPLRVLVRTIESFPAPVLGMIDGTVWGGACEVALACDFAVATPDATFAVTPAKLGIPYNISGLMTFLNVVPLPQLREMLFTARPISAARALDLGIINHIVAESEIEAYVQDLAKGIAANAPLAIAAMKEELRVLAAARSVPPQMFERVQGLRRVAYDSADYQEGQRAFKEKRRPVFKGE